MSKRSISEILATSGGYDLTEVEREAMVTLLEKKMVDVYPNFISALKKSHYGPFMIEGNIGKAFQEYYRSFYEDLIIPDFVRHFELMYKLAVSNIDEPGPMYTFMSDIFNHIYDVFLTNTSFLGHYLTHTNTLSATDDKINVVKYNTRLNHSSKRLLLEYSFTKDDIFSDEIVFEVSNPKVIGLYEKSIEVLSVVSTKNASLILGFNNDLYKKEGSDMSLSSRDNAIMFFDDDMNLFDYKKRGIRIKGVYANRETFFVLTMDGKVYINGNCGRVIGDDALGRINRGGGGGGGDNNIHRFTPIKLPANVAPIVYIYPFDTYENTFLVDAKDQVFVYDWIHPTDGFVLSDANINPDFPLRVTKYKSINTTSKVIDIQGRIALTEDKKFIHAWTGSQKAIVNANGNMYKEFEQKENMVLQFTSYLTYSVVLLSNQKIYIFDNDEETFAYILRKVIENKPVKWDEHKPEEKDVWTFQCSHCDRITVPLSIDYSNDAVLCSEECHQELYHKEYSWIMKMINKSL